MKMPKGWEIIKLGEVCDIQLGKTPHRKTLVFWDKDKKTSNIWLSISDLKHGNIIFDSKEYVSDLGAKKINITPRGTLMVSFKLTLGRVSFAGVDLFTNEAIASLINLNSKIIKQILFYYFSFLNWHKIAGGDIKVKGKTFNKKSLYNLLIIVPPMAEQKRIVKILDEAFAGIDKAKENAEKNLANAKELFQSYLNNIFANPGKDWEIKKLVDFYNITSSKRVFKSEWKISGVPFYRAREIVKLAKYGFVNNELFISKEMYNQYKKRYGIPKKEDIMVTGVGTLGRCYVVKPNDKFYFKDGNIIWLRKKKEINSKFVEYAFKSKYFINQIHDVVGATVRTFTIIRAKNTKLPTPPLFEQKQIVDKLDALSAESKRLEKIYTQKIANLDELKKSLLNKAFTGEL